MIAITYLLAFGVWMLTNPHGLARAGGVAAILYAAISAYGRWR